jgi:hypothetical protein
MPKIPRWPLLVAGALFLVGCTHTHTYHFVSGPKARQLNAGTLAVAVFAQELLEKDAEPAKGPGEVQERVEADALSTDSVAPASQLPDSADAMSAQPPEDPGPSREVAIRRGERQSKVLAMLGEPQHRHRPPLPLGRPGSEAWEYDFAIIYFRRRRAIDLVFTRVPGAAYYRGAPVVSPEHVAGSTSP